MGVVSMILFVLTAFAVKTYGFGEQFLGGDDKIVCRNELTGQELDW
jgi:hypothetical protein